MRKQHTLFINIIILIILVISSCGTAIAGEETKTTVYYFFENFCGSCYPENDFYDEFKELTGESLGDYSYIYANIYHESGKRRFEEVMAEKNIAKENQLLPMVIIGDNVYPGNTAIQNALVSDFIPKEAGATDSMIYYLSVPACESCGKVKKLLDDIGDSVTVKRGSVEFESGLIVNEVDMTGQADVAYRLFEMYNVPESEQIAPIIFFKDGYLPGGDRIIQSLEFRLARGQAIGTPLLDAQDGQLPALTLLGTLIAGFVGGINPCSLSMILFFLSLLMARELNIWKLSLPFIAGKLLAYVLIGLVFLEVFRTWNPTWLPLFSRVLLTVAGTLLAALNVLDFLAARSEKYGKIKNQLPAVLRKFNHDMIRLAIERKSSVLPLSLLLLGFIVAAGEFLCTGQVYLGTLLTLVQKGIGGVQAIGLFFAYGIAFILPPLVLTFVIAKGSQVFDVSEWVRGKMPVIKLVTAIIFIGMIVIIWFI